MRWCVRDHESQLNKSGGPSDDSPPDYMMVTGSGGMAQNL